MDADFKFQRTSSLVRTIKSPPIRKSPGVVCLNSLPFRRRRSRPDHHVRVFQPARRFNQFLLVVLKLGKLRLRRRRRGVEKRRRRQQTRATSHERASRPVVLATVPVLAFQR